MDCPPRWEQIGQTLDQFTHALLRIPAGRHDMSAVGSDWTDLTRHYFAEESNVRSEVDKAARHMAKRKEPPHNLTAAARYYLSLRVGCALDFLGMVFPPKSADAPFGDVPSDWSDERLIEWLLIDLWTRRFDTWLKLDAISAMGPFAFYGLEPADPFAQE